MKRSSAKAPRHKPYGKRTKDAKRVETDQGWGELEAQHDRVKSDWMSLAVQLGVGGRDKPAYE